MPSAAQMLNRLWAEGGPHMPHVIINQGCIPYGSYAEHSIEHIVSQVISFGHWFLMNPTIECCRNNKLEEAKNINCEDLDDFLDGKTESLLLDYMEYYTNSKGLLSLRSILSTYDSLQSDNQTEEEYYIGRDAYNMLADFWVSGKKSKSIAELSEHVDALYARFGCCKNFDPPIALEIALGRRSPNLPQPIDDALARAHDWLAITALRRVYSEALTLGMIEQPNNPRDCVRAPYPLYLAAAQVNPAFCYIFLQILRDNFSSIFIQDVDDFEYNGNLRPFLDGDLKAIVIEGMRDIYPQYNGQNIEFEDAVFDLIDIWEEEGGTDILYAKIPFWLEGE